MKKIGNKTYQSILDEKIIVVGGSMPEKFVPNINFSAWGNEYFWNINLPIAITNEKENFTDNRVSITAGGYGHIFYEKDNSSFEYEILLNAIPLINYIDFKIASKQGVHFYPQLDLKRQYELAKDHLEEKTFEEYAANRIMPENAIDSIAIYCDKSNNKYKNGKLGHIYRPKATDALGNSIWGAWELRDNDTLLRLTIDAAWLNNATYPVIIDPTFGVTADPLDGYGVGADKMYAVVPPTAPASSGTGDSITVCVTYASAGKNIKGVLVSADQTVLVDGAVGDAVAITTGSTAWFTSTFSGTKPTITADVADRPGFVDSAGGYIGYDYVGVDWPNDWYGRADSTNSYTTPANPGTMSIMEERLCIYCTYTEEAAGSILPLVGHSLGGRCNPMTG